jgi:hypothetical protein
VSRLITHRYRDPLDEIWLSTAARIGFSVQRSGEVYAHSDGRGLLHLAERSSFDPDDSLAQLVLHELCHAMVEGERAWTAPDWGLDNVSTRDEVREHAALRMQSKLTSVHGLRWVLAPTTDFRVYFDALPADPLSGDDEAVAPAREGYQRCLRSPFSPHLDAALERSARIAELTKPFAAEDSVFARFGD